MKSLIRQTSAIVVFLIAAVLWGVFGNTEEIATYGNSALLRWWGTTAFGNDFDHGRLIPLVCCYLVWLRRRELLVAAVGPDWRGLPLAAFAMLVYWFGVQGQQVQIALYSSWILLWAVVLGFLGVEVVRLVRFPLTYMFLALPLTFLYPLTFPLRLASTKCAYVLLNGIGIAVERNGTALHDLAGAFHLEVADPCSGLRSVFALVALTAVYAYLSLRGYKRWLLVVSTVPLAIYANAVRITTVGIVARLYGQERATGFYHDVSGYVFFVSATLLMLSVAWLLGKLPERMRKDASAEPSALPFKSDTAGAATGGTMTRPTCWHEWASPIGIPAVMAFAAVWVALRPPLQVSDSLPIVAQLPANVGVYRGEQVYYCQNENCLSSFSEEVGATTNLCPKCGASLDVVALAERRGLPPDTKVAKRVYRSTGGSVFSVNTVIAGEDRRSIHRPEHCLTGQGLSVEKIRKEHAAAGNGKEFDLAVITTRRAESDLRTGFVYWFVGPDRETTSNLKRHFWTAYDRLFRNTASRWAYVSIMGNKPFDTPEDLAEVTQFAAELRAILLGQE